MVLSVVVVVLLRTVCNVDRKVRWWIGGVTVV